MGYSIAFCGLLHHVEARVKGARFSSRVRNGTIRTVWCQASSAISSSFTGSVGVELSWQSLMSVEVLLI